jgi:hypothetical protein
MDNVRNFFPALLEADKWLAALEEGEKKEKVLSARLSDLEASIASGEKRQIEASRAASSAEESARLVEAAGQVKHAELSELTARVTDFQTHEQLLAAIESERTTLENLRAEHDAFKSKVGL